MAMPTMASDRRNCTRPPSGFACCERWSPVVNFYDELSDSPLLTHGALSLLLCSHQFSHIRYAADYCTSVGLAFRKTTRGKVGRGGVRPVTCSGAERVSSTAVGWSLPSPCRVDVDAGLCRRRNHADLPPRVKPLENRAFARKRRWPVSAARSACASCRG